MQVIVLQGACIGNGIVAAMVIGEDQSLVADDLTGAAAAKDQYGILIEDLLMEYNCSLVSFRPFFTISLYTCWPSSMGSHIPSSALAFNKLGDNNSDRTIFFI